jgi:hypothetical protein
MAATCVTVPLGPACVNITGVRGGDRNLMTATVTAKGQPVDLTDKTLAAQARKAVTDTGTPALEAVIEVVDAPAGDITIRWPGDAVTALLAGKKSWTGVWDLQVIETGLDPLTIAAGTFAAEMDVTR